MISCDKKDLNNLISNQYQVAGLLDLDYVISRPFNYLVGQLQSLHKPYYAPQERICVYGNSKPTQQIVDNFVYLANKIDISPDFILFCTPDQPHTFEHFPISFRDNDLCNNLHPLFIMPENFCLNPWMNLDFHNRGTVAPCCVYKEPLRDNKNQQFNIKTNSLEDIIHSPQMSDLRSQFASNQRPVNCEVCWHKESSGGESNRVWANDLLFEHVDKIDLDNPTIDSITTLKLPLGTLCNFRCRMCTHVLSSRIAHELYVQTGNEEYKRYIQQTDWETDNTIWKKLNNIGSNIKNIELIGGEPLLVKSHIKFLKHLIDNNYAHDIRLSYNTNGSVHANLYNDWKKFKHVNLAFSIDDTGDRFEIQRDGGVWKEVTANIANYTKNKLSNMSLSVYCTVNVQNILYLDELVQWAETQNFDSFHFNFLNEPKWLNIKYIHNDIAIRSIEKLQKLNKPLKDKYKLDIVIDKLQNNQYSNTITQEFYEQTLLKDKLRNQNFFQAHKELGDLLGFIIV